MKKIISFLAVYPLILSLISCSQSGTNSLAEARNFGESILKDYAVKCGNSWYVGFSESGWAENPLATLRQLKNSDKIAIDVIPDLLDESDILKGLEFNGLFQFSYNDAPGRDYDVKKKTWGPWFNNNGAYIHFRIQKRNGEWSAERLFLRKVSCADVPKND